MFRVSRTGFMVLMLLWSVAPSFAQSQAINGTIEGRIADESGGALPGVVVTMSNVDTGDTRVVVSNDTGMYRAPLLGRYRVSAEPQGFGNSSSRGLLLPVRRRHQRHAQAGTSPKRTVR